MKHQYVGDINNYRKFALLWTLSMDGANRIGVFGMALTVALLSSGASG